MIHFRSYRNFDPPLLVEVWCASLAGPRVVPSPSATLLEYFLFSKPWFDPAGMIFALEDAKPVGVVHAGFGGGANGVLDTSLGVVCLLAVVPSHRRQGIGGELLRRAEEYLHGSGANEMIVGAMAPHNPFLFGLYGGCDSAGVLESEEQARPFLAKHGYTQARSCGLFQRSLERMQMPADARFHAIRQRYDIIAAPYGNAGWWREGVLGPVEAVEYRLQDKQNETVVARTILWDMDTFTQNWSETCVGMIDLEVKPPFRKQGLAKYLLAQVLRHLRQQPFQLFEIRADLDNTAAFGLLHTLGFQQVEAGHCYRRDKLS